MSNIKLQTKAIWFQDDIAVQGEKEPPEVAWSRPNIWWSLLNSVWETFNKWIPRWWTGSGRSWPWWRRRRGWRWRRRRTRAPRWSCSPAAAPTWCTSTAGGRSPGTWMNRKGFRVPFDIHCFNKLDTLAISLSVMPWKLGRGALLDICLKIARN